MDDEPIWAAERVVAPTPGSTITIPETANEFFIKDTKNEAARLMMFPLSLTGEAKTWLDKLNERTIKTWDELRTDFISRFFPLALFDRLLGEIHAFSQNENECLTDAWLRMKEMLRNFHGHNMSKGNIIKIFYHGLNEITQKVLNATAGGIFLYKTPNQAYQLSKDSLTQARLGKIKKPNHLLRKLLLSPLKQSTNAFVKETFMDLKTRLETVAKNHQASIQNLKTKFDRLADKQSSRPSILFQGTLNQIHEVTTLQPINHRNLVMKTPINFDSDDEDDEPTPQPKTQPPKPVKEKPLPKP
ncbi:reverse transcriptase domain-containing protein [Tanacetum coccineum]